MANSYYPGHVWAGRPHYSRRVAGATVRSSRFSPEAVAGVTNEYVLQSRLAYRESADFSGESFDNIGDEAVAVFDFQADVAIHNGRVDREAVANALR